MNNYNLKNALYLISETANSAQNLEELYRSIHMIIGELIPAKNLFIAIYEEGTDTVHFPYYSDEFFQNPGKRKSKKGLTEYIIRTGQPLVASPSIYAEMLKQGDIESIGMPAKDWMGVPLKIAEKKVIGVLAVRTYTEGVRYKKQDMDILNFVSTQVAMAVQRKRAEEALRESEQQYRAIVENSHDAIYIFSENNIVYANHNLCTLLEVSQQEIAKSDFLQYIHPRDKMMIQEYMTKQECGDQVVSAVEARIISKKGQTKFIQLNLTKIIYKGKSAFIGVVSDITERKVAEKLQKALYLISETVNSSLDLEKLYTSIHGIIGELIMAENFFIAIYDKKSDVVHFPYHVDEKMANPGPRKNGRGLTDYVIQMGQPLVVSQRGHADLVRQGKIKVTENLYVNWLGVPLKTAENEVFGVLGVKTHKESIPYTQKDKDILSFVSNQVAMAIRRKQDETSLKGLGFRDSLSGLYNRRYFEEEMRRMDKRRQGSVGLIILDVDGLKLVNDMLGHDSGDMLISNVAKLLTSCFRDQDIVARIGGDEYAILLHDADIRAVKAACKRVQKSIAVQEKGKDTDSNHLPLSLSIGFAVSDNTDVPMRELFKQADNNMYREKLKRGQSARNAIVQTMLKLLEERDFIRDGHADRMQNIAIKLGEQCGLPRKSLADLCLFSRFHDVGKVGIRNGILLKPGKLTIEELKEIQSHSEIGYRIAQSSADLLPIADLILRHHEWWNGKGYPLGLAGEDIPLECRILGIADAYDAMTNDRPYRKAISHEAAITELKRCAGKQFDPELVDKFVQMKI